MRSALPALTALALGGCATARMHDQEALNQIALGCGMSYGELIQDEEEKTLLFALKSNIGKPQRDCVKRWAKRNHLRPVFVHIEMSQS